MKEPLRRRQIVEDRTLAAGRASEDIDLSVTRDPSGVPTRLHVPVLVNGRSAKLLFDTGSALSFLATGRGTPDFTPVAGTVTLAGRRVTLPGRNIEPSREDGVGALGADVLLGAPTLLDLRTGALVRSVSDAQLAEARRWPALPFENVRGHLLVRALVDGRPLRLMLDTGSPHLMWLRAPRGPNEAPLTTTDAIGNPVPMFYGHAALRLGTMAAMTVPVLKVASFPYFEQTVRQLGGSLDGLLGLSSLGSARVFFEPGAGTMRFQPRR
jgi:hypothetical protein